MAEVRLVDLELIKRYSLAVRRDTVDAEELLAALDASRATVEAAMGRGVTAPAASPAVPPQPAAPTPRAKASTKPATSATKAATPTARTDPRRATPTARSEPKGAAPPAAPKAPVKRSVKGPAGTNSSAARTPRSPRG